MAFPQLNVEQVETLEEMCEGISAFSQVVPELKKDGPENYSLFMDKTCDTNQLLILGLIKEITQDNMEKIAELYSMTDRKFRVFEITDMGRKMFSKTKHRAVN